jgi:HEAT repeat protein
MAPSFLRVLLLAVEDDSPIVRAAAAAAVSLAAHLEPIRRRSVENALGRLLSDEDAEVRAQAVDGLRTLFARGREPFPSALVEHLGALVHGDPSPGVRAAATTALASNPRSPASEAALAKALTDPAAAVRAAAVAAVANVGATEEMVPALLAALEVPAVANDAREALERIPAAREQMDVVLARLGTRLAAVIEAAREDGLEHDPDLESLLRVLGPRAVPHLQRLLGVWNDLAFEPEEGLRATGRAGATEVMRVLREGAREQRVAAAEAVTVFAETVDLVGALVSAMQDEDDDVRAVATAGLGRLSGEVG